MKQEEVFLGRNLFNKRVKTERFLAFMALLIMIVAGIIGANREKEIFTAEVEKYVPDGCGLTPLNVNTFAVFSIQSPDVVSYYLTGIQTKGYGGAMELAIMVDTSGGIIGINVLRHKETPSYMTRISKKNLKKDLIGKTYSDSLTEGIDIDAVTGATYSSRAIIKAARIGCRIIAREQLNYTVPEELRDKVTIGLAEISLLLLFISAIIAQYFHGRPKKIIHWFIWLTSLTLLGFWFAVPLSLVKINSFLMGYMPEWQTGLYWYLILAVFIFPILFTGKNLYCKQICPFGAMQECLGQIGGAKQRFTKKWVNYLRWFQRVMAWIAICLALFFQNPVQFNYQIFGVAFTLTGSIYLFAILFLFIIAALFIRRPYCNILCPINAIADLLSMMRKWIMEQFFQSAGTARSQVV